ncbi:MAG: hypothetical protein WC861_00975 [Candidatus Micrarchaeia archaeon]|jgi:hypothetical protein
MAFKTEMAPNVNMGTHVITSAERLNMDMPQAQNFFTQFNNKKAEPGVEKYASGKIQQLTLKSSIGDSFPIKFDSRQPSDMNKPTVSVGDHALAYDAVSSLEYNKSKGTLTVIGESEKPLGTFRAPTAAEKNEFKKSTGGIELGSQAFVFERATDNKTMLFDPNLPNGALKDFDGNKFK